MMLRKVTSLTLLILFAVFGLTIINQHKVSALSGSDFISGRIIDDTVMYNGNTMTTPDIQSFLNAKVPVCDTNGTQASSHWYDAAGRYYTRAEWGAESGYPAPFTCLKDYSESTPTKSPDAYCQDAYAGGVKSAAQIINDVAHACNVSQKAILVLLQKEQSLVSDDWPWSIQYRSATGFGCPDTAVCDSTYYGFFNQVYNAARQFQRYVKQSTLFNYKAGATSYIQYNPNAACGGSNVYIENPATAALYNYTPYQPNASALNNLYGAGDGCGAYGNRNFWRMFNDWFGSTYAPDFSAQPVWQSVFSDNTKTQSIGWNATLREGQTAYAVVKMKNTGNVTWTKSGGSGVSDTRLATYDAWGRNSVFCNSDWVINCTRPSALIETSIAPGETGTFEFPIKAPKKGGIYNESFGLVVDGRTTFTSGTVTFQFTVQPNTYTAQPIYQQIFTDLGKSTPMGWNATLTPGQNAFAVIVVKNTSNITWVKGGENSVRLATYGWGRISPFCAGRWITTSPNCTRAAEANEASVAPGQNATYEFPLNAPSGINVYDEQFGLIIDGKTTFTSGITNLRLTVEAKTYTAAPIYQQVFTNSAKTTALGWNGGTLTHGQSYWASVVMRNTSNFTWTKNTNPGISDVRLVTYSGWGRQSAFCTNTWLIPCTRPALLQETTVAPGQNSTYEFLITAPNQTGVYNEAFSLVVDGKSTFTSGVMNFQFTVN